MKKIQEVCVGGVIQNVKGEILFVKRSDDDDFMPGFWELPGGATDFGEESKKAIIREIKEECGLDVTVERPLAVQDYTINSKDESRQYVEILFLCKQIDAFQEIKLSFEHSSFIFLPIDRANEIELSEYMINFVNEIKGKI